MQSEEARKVCLRQAQPSHIMVSNQNRQDKYMFCRHFKRCANNLIITQRSPIGHSTMGRPKAGRRQPAVNKPPLTHFLCLPLVTSASRPQLETALGEFRHGVCDTDPPQTGDIQWSTGRTLELPKIDSKSVRPIGALHCTLGVMSLNEEELIEATEYLQGLDVRQILSEASAEPVDFTKLSSTDASTLERPISPPTVSRAIQPLMIDLKGIESMHATQQTSILYAAPKDATGRLLPFCKTIQTLFNSKGFLRPDNRELKLHATLVNTIYARGRKRPAPRGLTISSTGQLRPDRSQGHGPDADTPLKIDATGLLEKYKDFVWAENVVLDRVAICEMGAKKIMNDAGEVVDQEYTEVASIQLPS
jgi:activating signal cointegrator complex subunit 1